MFWIMSDSLFLVKEYLPDYLTGVDIDDNSSQVAAADAIVVHIFGRPVNPDDPTLSNCLGLFIKILDKVGLEDLKTLLGWFSK